MSIAIVGMSCRLPGGINNLSDFWDFCSEGRSAWSPNPKTRFPNESFFHPDASKPGFLKNRGGHYIDQDLSLFDAAFFKITANEAKAMDPQQRIILETIYESLENSGTPLHCIRGKNIGVFVGDTPTEYGQNILMDLDTVPMYTATGNDNCMLANRVSYVFDLHGPSMTINTACSSSLTALHIACQSLRCGESSQAIVAGCHLNVLPDTAVSLTKSQLLSTEGKSYPFDQRATEGFGRGEGAVSLVLKPLDKAEAEGDHIYAVIRHTEINQDGKTIGITMPSVRMQKDLMASAYGAAGLHPQDTRYIEAHGTGTSVGDPIEATAIGQVFGRSAGCGVTYLGSVKSDFGHLEGTSGVLGILKTAMMLEKGIILPNHDFRTPSPNVLLDEYKLKVPSQTFPWPASKCRRASVNSFGYGGSNAHIILEQAPHKILRRTETASSRRLYPISAADKNALARQVALLLQYVSKRPQEFHQFLLDDLAYTLAARRSPLSWRTMVTATNTTELIAQLSNINIADLKKSRDNVSIAFAFTGQGAQWTEMGRELMEYPVYRDSIREIDQILESLGAARSVEDMLYINPDDPHSNMPHVTSTAVQVGLVNLLRSWGIHPRAVVGHSSGEIAAAFAAGILSLRSCIAVTYHRGRLIEKLKAESADAKGAMIAVGGNEQDVKTMLGSLASGSAVIGCWNSPSSFTVSGDEPAIMEMKDRLDNAGIYNRRLDVEIAYHSPHMKPIADEYQKSLLQDVKSLDSNISYYSSTKGKLLQSPNLDATYWTENMVDPVQFTRTMQQMFTNKSKDHDEINCVIEVGPHSALRAPIKQILENLGLHGKISYFPTLARGKDALEMVTNLAVGLFKEGSSFSLSSINVSGDETANVLTDLPTYPWTHAEYWHESRLSRDRRLRLYPNNELLGHTTIDFNPNEPRWRNIINISSIPWLEHYRVDSQAVVSLSSCLSMAIEAMHQYLVSKSQSPIYYYLRDVSMKETIILDRTDTELEFALRTYSTSAQETSGLWREFIISTWTEKSGWTENCRGLISADMSHQRYDDNVFSLSEKSSNIAAENEKVVSLDTSEIYRTIENYGMEFGTAFRRLENVESSKSITTVTTKSLDVDVYAEGKYVIHPLSLEGWLQACLPAASVTGKRHSDTCFPVLLNEMIVNPRSEDLGSGQFRLKAFSGKFHAAANEIVSSILVESQNMGNTSRPMGAIEGLRFRRPLLRFSEPAKLCFREKWDIFLELNTSAHLKDALRIHADSSKERDQIRQLNEISRHFIHKAVYELDSLPQGTLQSLEGERANLYAWMKRQVQRDLANVEVVDDEYQCIKDLYILDDKLVFEVANSGCPGAFISRIGEKLPQIAVGEVEPLELMLEDNLLSKNYEEDVSMDCRSYPCLAHYVRLLAHQNPRMRILEIGAGTGGATRKILESLGGYENRPACFERYDYTDISAGFFPQAKTKFHQWQSYMTYKKLDIEKQLTDQGFQEHSYDLVIAVNVLHATANMHRTLQNVRTLLKLNGKLALIELVSPGCTVFPFATLPGWWLGKESFRQDGPTLSQETWNDLLGETGFTGIDLNIEDYPGHAEHQSSVIVSTAATTVQKNFTTDLSIIHSSSCRDTAMEVLRLAQHTLNYNPRVLSIAEAARTSDVSSDVILLKDEVSSTSVDDDQLSFNCLKKICRAKYVVWVVHGALEDGTNPSMGIDAGLARSIRNEQPDLRLALLDIEQNCEDALSDIASDILNIFRYIKERTENDLGDCEFEFSRRGGIIRIPRLVEEFDLNEDIHRERYRLDVSNSQSTETEALVQKRTLIPTNNFLQGSSSNNDKLAPDHVKIHVYAVGLGHADIPIFKGVVDGHIGKECSGIIVEVGLDVHDYNVGDRVCAFADGSYTDYVCCPALWTSKIPDNMPFATAASIAAAFGTVLYALVYVAQISQGQKILIHDAAAPMGQLAICIAHNHRAEIYAIVQSLEEELFLRKSGKVKDDCILLREEHMHSKIMKATRNQGINVILTSGQNSATTWDCLAPMGHLLELGKENIAKNARLHTAIVDRNVSLSSIDLEVVRQSRPQLLRQILNVAVALQNERLVDFLTPCLVYSHAELHSALHTLANDCTMSKIVIQTEGAASPRFQHQMFSPNATYLITGGTGGVGRAIARWMAHNGAKFIILASRSGPRAENISQFLQEIEILGVKIKAISCDITNNDEVVSLLTALKLDFPSLRGIIHGAQNYKAISFEEMTYTDYQEILQPKVKGALNLYSCLEDSRLDFFIMLSSISVILGIHGQSAYSAANQFLGTFSNYLSQKGHAAHCINTGPLYRIGHPSTDSLTSQHTESLQMTPVSELDLYSLLRLSIRHQLANPTGVAAWYTSLTPEPGTNPPWLKDSRFSHSSPRRSSDFSPTQANSTHYGITRAKDLLQNAHSRDEELQIISGILTNKIMAIFALQKDNISPSRSLYDYGMDSLIATELRSWVYKEMSATLSTSDITSCNSLDQLGELIMLRRARGG